MTTSQAIPADDEPVLVEELSEMDLLLLARASLLDDFAYALVEELVRRHSARCRRDERERQAEQDAAHQCSQCLPSVCFDCLGHDAT